MKDIEKFKNLLEEEKKRIEESLALIGRKDPEIQGEEGWEAAYPDLNSMTSDKNEAADEVVEFADRVGVEMNLEARLVDVTGALGKIKNGKYGMCEKGGEEIDEKRLEANPASKTCIHHSK